jgi:hypothetical protein
MAELTFTSQDGSQELNVPIKPDYIKWSYGLNTQTTPTYGGEVIQILSAFISDMTVGGQVRTYSQAEKIYEFFVDKLTQATQQGKFKHQKGVTMYYPERDWTFKLLPLALSPLKYGRDIVVPEWEVRFHVMQADQDVISLITEQESVKALANRFGVPSLFGQATGNIGWEEDDPFRSPIPDDKKLNDFYKDLIGGETVRYQASDLGDWFNNLIPSYLQGNFDDLSADYSRPSFGQSNNNRTQGRNSGIKANEAYVKARTKGSIPWEKGGGNNGGGGNS